MPIIRRKLDPNTVYPDDLRYDADTDQVERNVNGTWVDAPESDPRTKTLFPPRITSDPTCDAAESVKNALHGQIDGVLEAIDNSATLFTIAGIILSIFTFGAYAIFITIALAIGDNMLTAGTAALTAALTEPVYDLFACILFCHMDANGRVKPGEFNLIINDVNNQIGGLAATILNAMVLLAGEGGVNNLAALGTSTGDCSACDCGCDELSTGDTGGGVGTVTYLGDNNYQLISAARNVGGHDFQECGFAASGFSPCYRIDVADFGPYTLRPGTPYQILCDNTVIGDAGLDPNRSLKLCAFATVADNTTPFVITIHVCPT